MNTTAQQSTHAASVTLFTGTDEFDVSRHARQFVDAVCPPAEQTLGLEIIDAACDTIEEAVSAVRRCLDGICTVGFFGAGKLVWLRDATFFYDGKPGKYEEVKQAVAKLTEEIKRGLMPGSRLVISAAQVDKRTAFYKAVEKAGAIKLFNLPEKSYQWDKHAATVAESMLRDAGLNARADVIRLLVERAGHEGRQLAIEIEKLALYLKGRAEVKASDVLDIVSPARERGYGELTDAVSKRDLPNALRIARQLIQQKENPVGLIIGLETRIRDLLVYRTALARRWARLGGSDDWPKVEWNASPEAEQFFAALPNDPRKANPFWAGILAKQASRFGLETLQQMQRVLVEEHGRMTDGSAPADILLDCVLIKLLGAQREPLPARP